MSEDFPITIYHKPNCGASRNTLAMIRAAGYEPTVVEYLKVGWTRPLLDDIVAATGAKPRDLIREKERLPLSLDCSLKASATTRSCPQ